MHDSEHIPARLLTEDDDEIEVKLKSRRGKLRLVIGLAGFLGGIALILVQIIATEPGPHHVRHVLTELALHLGIGFIVAAVAVIAYEWGSEVNAALRLSHGLQRVLAASASDAIDRGARTLLRNDFERFHGLVSSVHVIAALYHYRAWSRPAYLRFLTVVSDSAHRVAASVATVTRYDADLPQSFPLKTALAIPRPDDLVDELLAGLLDELHAGDEYYAVSNARIWMDLKRFHRANIDAVARGVKIRRVFILFDESDAVLSPAATIEIIYGHFREALQLHPPNGYEMRVANRGEYHALAPLLEHHSHFGAFRPKNGERIKVTAVKDDLSEIDLERSDSDDHFDAFEQLWNNLQPRDDSELRFVLRAERMRKLRPGGRYRAISRLADWQQPQLRRFHDEVLTRVRSAAVTVERIFLNDGTLASEELLRFLADQHHASSAHGKGRYRWKFHSGRSESPTIPMTVAECVPFGIFEEVETASGQTLSELYGHDSLFLFARPHSDVINSGFDDLWRQLSTRDELVGLLPNEHVDALCGRD